MSSLIEVGEDFPQVCETCLGGNPYVRMSKLPFGSKLCKISAKPFQSFRWKAGPAGREKETIVSIAVAKEKNICQACLNDMVFGLPVGVRDSILKSGASSTALAAPSSDVGKLYHYNQLEDGSNGQELGAGNGLIAGGMKTLAAVRQLDKFSKGLYSKQASSSSGAPKAAPNGIWDEYVPESKPRSIPFGAVAFRNLPKLCSFWVAGTCSRVTKGACPFRPCCGPAAYAFPELAASNKPLCAQLVSDLSQSGPAAVMQTMGADTREGIRTALKGNNRDKSIAQRVSGDDALSAKYVKALRTGPGAAAEAAAKSAGSTLWLGSVGEAVAEEDISGALYAYGHIVSIRIARQGGCAFVEYSQHSEAAEALQQAGPALDIGGCSVRLGWARAMASDAEGAGGKGAALPVGVAEGEGSAGRKRPAEGGGAYPSTSKARLGAGAGKE